MHMISTGASGALAGWAWLLKISASGRGGHGKQEGALFLPSSQQPSHLNRSSRFFPESQANLILLHQKGGGETARERGDGKPPKQNKKSEIPSLALSVERGGLICRQGEFPYREQRWLRLILVSFPQARLISENYAESTSLFPGPVQLSSPEPLASRWGDLSRQKLMNVSQEFLWHVRCLS